VVKGHPLTELLATGLMFCGAYAAVWVLLPGGKRTATELVEMAAQLRPRRKAAPAARAAGIAA
jgi:hypothetical protein